MLWTECFQLDTLPCLIASFKLEPLFKHSGCKHSNISGCQKFKYFKVSKTQIFLVVKHSDIFGCQKFEYFWLSKVKRQSTYFKFLAISDHCPWNHFVKSLSLISCRLAVKLERTRAKFCFAQNLRLAFQHYYKLSPEEELVIISCHPEEELVPVLFKIIGGTSCAINETTSRRLPPLWSS